jgi:hypothetical protein
MSYRDIPDEQILDMIHKISKLSHRRGYKPPKRSKIDSTDDFDTIPVRWSYQESDFEYIDDKIIQF